MAFSNAEISALQLMFGATFSVSKFVPFLGLESVNKFVNISFFIGFSMVCYSQFKNDLT